MATAYTLAMEKPATMNAARIMWTVCGGVAGLNIAAHGSTVTTRPLTVSKPVGCCIHALAVTTKNALATPAMTMGMPESMCWTGGIRSQA
jgi:hypothetical protein